jgi:hypothetical protein
MTSVTELLDRVPVEEINETAERITPARTIGTLLGGLFFLLGWVTAKIVTGAWFCLRWSFAAALVGWKSARGEELIQPDVGKILQENQLLRAELERDDLSAMRAENDQLRAEVQRLRRLK